MQNDIWSLSNFTNAQSWVVLIQNNISLKFTLIHFTLLIELKLSMKKINLNWISLDSTAVSIFAVLPRLPLKKCYHTIYLCKWHSLGKTSIFTSIHSCGKTVVQSAIGNPTAKWEANGWHSLGKHVFQTEKIQRKKLTQKINNLNNIRRDVIIH